MKRIYFIRIVIFLTILTVPVLTMNFKSEQVSEIDNRNLTEFSDIYSGDFTATTEAFVNDRIGFRTEMINFYTRSMDYLFNYMVHPSYQYGKDGYVFSKLSREAFSPEFQETFSDFILKLQSYCNDRNIQFLYCVEPSKLTVYPEFLPTGVNYQNLSLNYLLTLLKEKNINYLYTGDVLIEAKDSYQVFDKKFDANHWNETGAIIGISEILNRLHEMDPNVDNFNINNYSLSVKTNNTLPVSYFPINEKTTIYTLEDPNVKSIDLFKDKIHLSEHYRNFSHYINEGNTDAPRILVFAGSYFNGKDKFLTESFSEYILVHNYFNILDIDYYINLFNPDIVLFESTEYTHNDTYFNSSSMKDVVYNEPLSKYSNLSQIQFTSVNGDIEMNNNDVITDFSIKLSNNNTLYSYANINDRVLDCKTITNDNNEQYINFSIPSSYLCNLKEFTIYCISQDETERAELKIELN